MVRAVYTIHNFRCSKSDICSSNRRRILLHVRWSTNDCHSYNCTFSHLYKRLAVGVSNRVTRRVILVVFWWFFLLDTKSRQTSKWTIVLDGWLYIIHGHSSNVMIMLLLGCVRCIGRPEWSTSFKLNLVESEYSYKLKSIFSYIQNIGELCAQRCYCDRWRRESDVLPVVRVHGTMVPAISNHLRIHRTIQRHEIRDQVNIFIE